jgi:hypothetical protein
MSAMAGRRKGGGRELGANRQDVADPSVEGDMMSDVAGPDEGGTYDPLIHGLTADLTPVRRLRRPLLRTSFWLGAVIVATLVLAVFVDVTATERRLTAAPDLWLAVTGSALTAVLAATAAFQLSLPDGKAIWALLPMPSAVLWVSASGLGCLRTWLVPGTHDASLAEAKDCFVFIVGLSIPLSAILILLLRRGYPLRPNLMGLIGGLAVAAASATLLNFFHPYDAAATDLTVHAIAVGIVISTNQWVTYRLSKREHSRLKM